MATQRIEISRLSYLFQRLQFPNFEAVMFDEDDEELPKKFHIQGAPIRLHPPLFEAQLYLAREGEFYSGLVKVAQIPGIKFQGLGQEIEKIIRENKWIQVSDCGEGYILDNNGEPALSIICSQGA